jgi:hypothetical protein
MSSFPSAEEQVLRAFIGLEKEATVRVIQAQQI